MKYTARRIHELTLPERHAWETLRGTHPALQSPLFSLALIESVDRLRGNVFVGVAKRDDDTVAMMPYCRVGATAVPFAGPLCDIQAVLTNDPKAVCMREMLRGLDLSAAHFNAQLVVESPMSQECYRTELAPYIDVSQGFEAYREERRKAKSDELKEALRKSRKIERELGEVVFDHACGDPGAFNQILEWKSAQLKQGNRFNGLKIPWVRSVLEDIVMQKTDDCEGMVCCLRVAGELAAGAIAVRSREVLHGWVMAYNPDPKFRKYSPGILLLTQLLQRCETIGVHRVDMGRGNESYKKSFQSGGYEIGEAAIDLYAWRGAVRRTMISVREWLGHSPLKHVVQTVVNRRRYAANVEPRSGS